MCVCVCVCLEGKERRRRQKRRIRRKKMQRKRGGKERGGEGRQGKKKKKKNKKCRQAPGPQAYIFKCFQLWNILSLYNHTGCAFLMPKYQFHQSKYISSVQFSCSVMSDSLWPHGLQHTRPPCPSPAPGIYSNTCPLNPWCHPTISSSVIPFSSCLQSFPASGSFQMSQFFSSGGQSIRVSASASVLPMNIQDRFPLGWTGWISSPRGSEESSPTPQFKYIRYWKK